MLHVTINFQEVIVAIGDTVNIFRYSDRQKGQVCVCVCVCVCEGGIFRGRGEFDIDGVHK